MKHLSKIIPPNHFRSSQPRFQVPAKFTQNNPKKKRYLQRDSARGSQDEARRAVRQASFIKAGEGARTLCTPTPTNAEETCLAKRDQALNGLF